MPLDSARLTYYRAPAGEDEHEVTYSDLYKPPNTDGGRQQALWLANGLQEYLINDYLEDVFLSNQLEIRLHALRKLAGLLDLGHKRALMELHRLAQFEEDRIVQRSVVELLKLVANRKSST